MAHNVTEIQHFLLAQQPPFDIGPYGADGKIGFATLKAINAFLVSKKRPEFVGVPTLIEINAAMFPEDAPPPAPKPTFTIPGISEIGNIIAIFNQAKELQMNTANVDVISAWLSSKNWAAAIIILTNIANLFHIVIPPDLAPSVTAVITAVGSLYIIIKNTWFTTTVTQASANNIAAGK